MARCPSRRDDLRVRPAGLDNGPRAFSVTRGGDSGLALVRCSPRSCVPRSRLRLTRAEGPWYSGARSARAIGCFGLTGRTSDPTPAEADDARGRRRLVLNGARPGHQRIARWVAVVGRSGRGVSAASSWRQGDGRYSTFEHRGKIPAGVGHLTARLRVLPRAARAAPGVGAQGSPLVLTQARYGLLGSSSSAMRPTTPAGVLQSRSSGKTADRLSPARPSDSPGLSRDQPRASSCRGWAI